jgi:hypothetical protein
MSNVQAVPRNIIASKNTKLAVFEALGVGGIEWGEVSSLIFYFLGKNNLFFLQEIQIYIYGVINLLFHIEDLSSGNKLAGLKILIHSTYYQFIRIFKFKQKSKLKIKLLYWGGITHKCVVIRE